MSFKKLIQGIGFSAIVLFILPTHTMSWRQKLSKVLCTAGKAFSVGFPLGMGIYKSDKCIKALDIMKKEESRAPAIPEDVEKQCRSILIMAIGKHSLITHLTRKFLT